MPKVQAFSCGKGGRCGHPCLGFRPDGTPMICHHLRVQIVVEHDLSYAEQGTVTLLPESDYEGGA